MSDGTIHPRRLAAERRLAESERRRVRRTPVVVVGLAAGLTLATGITGVIDLRRLDTPAGAAQAWVLASYAADCDRWELLSTPATGGAASLDCAGLGRLAAERTGRVDVVVVGAPLVDGDAARATVRLVRTPGGETTAEVRLQRTDRWRVVRDGAACDLGLCP